MKYLCKVKLPFKGLKVGEEVILPQSVIKKFIGCVDILKEYKDKLEVMIK